MKDINTHLLLIEISAALETALELAGDAIRSEDPGKQSDAVRGVDREMAHIKRSMQPILDRTLPPINRVAS